MGTPNKEPPRILQEYDRNVPIRVLTLLLDSYNIVGTPCLEFSVESFCRSDR